MEERSLSKKERFQVLLSQLGMTGDDVVQYFNNAEIEKLSVYRKEKKWHFHFALDQIIPCKVMNQFSNALRSSFKHIAQVGFSVKVLNTEATEQHILDYWTECIKEVQGISPPLLKILNTQKPKIQGNKIVVQASNDTEATQLKKKYSDIICSAFEQFGFPRLMLDA
ncbi:PolC-type DNA polymerase III N-terminal domain-containing protein, partial [Rossellomorea marisflavi]